MTTKTELSNCSVDSLLTLLENTVPDCVGTLYEGEDEIGTRSCCHESTLKPHSASCPLVFSQNVIKELRVKMGRLVRP